MTPMTRSTAAIEELALSRRRAMRARMSFAALPVSTERDLTSDATTAKPLPAVPARAASMVALRARRFVCRATAEIVSMIPTISSVAWASSAMSRLAPPPS